MKMELIQPFINAADAVLSRLLECRTSVGELTMDDAAYHRRGAASLVTITGDIEGRIIFDIDPATVVKVANSMAGMELEESDEVTRETVCELANLVIGNAVTALNDQGFRFKVHPPEVHAADTGLLSSEDTEAMLMRFTTCEGDVYMNIAMRYNRRRRAERDAAIV